MKEKIETLKKYIDECNNVVFFGGAGVSTASGIPDFRSKDGLYNQKDIQFEKYDPEYLLSHECLVKNQKVFFEFYRQKLDTRNIKPNITHYKLAELEAQGKLKCVVTQNIDGLHQKAGSKNVCEIHGTTLKAYCMKCGKIHDFGYLFDCDEDIPICDCGGVIRPDVTLYGEQLPGGAWDRAYLRIAEADMLIVAGTSLSVYPAANLVSEFQGKYLVVVNREPLNNCHTDLEIIGDMTDVFKAL